MALTVHFNLELKSRLSGSAPPLHVCVSIASKENSIFYNWMALVSKCCLLTELHLFFEYFKKIASHAAPILRNLA